jgi:hypothetical protein
MIDERHLTETQVGNRRSRRFIVGRHRPKSETMSLVGIGIWGVSVMSVKLYAFTCGWLTGEFGRLMEGGEGDITVPAPVFLIEHPKGAGAIRYRAAPRLPALSPDDRLQPTYSHYCLLLSRP